MKINSREQKNIQFLDIITKGKTLQFNDDHQHITEIKNIFISTEILNDP